MSDEESARSVDISSLALELVGEYSKLQDIIDLLVKRYAEARAPSLATFLDSQRILFRLKDENRSELVCSISDELATDADMSRFNAVFNQVKVARDFIAHGTAVTRINEDRLQIQPVYVTGPDVKQRGIKRKEPLVLDRSKLIALLHETRWLHQHVMYLLASSDLSNAIHVSGQEVRVNRPPSGPEGWDGTPFTWAKF